MKYRVYNTKSEKFEDPENCIVTQEGKVAFWDESQGWNEYTEIHQKYYIILLEKL